MVITEAYLLDKGVGRRSSSEIDMEPALLNVSPLKKELP